jgi:hypothetical protein
LCRTESGIQMPALDIGDSFLSMPVDLKGMSVLADPKEVEEAMSQMDGQHPVPEKHPMPKDSVPKDPYSSSSDEEPTTAKDPVVSAPISKGRPPLGTRNPLMRSSRKKSTHASDIPSLLATPATSRKDPEEHAIQYGLFPMDD